MGDRRFNVCDVARGLKTAGRKPVQVRVLCPPLTIGPARPQAWDPPFRGLCAPPTARQTKRPQIALGPERKGLREVAVYWQAGAPSEVAMPSAGVVAPTKISQLLDVFWLVMLAVQPACVPVPVVTAPSVLPTVGQ